MKAAERARAAGGGALVAGLALVLAAGGCGQATRDPAAPGSASPSASAPAEGGASARLSDRHWQYARSEDSLEKARLAEHLGAAGLLDALDDPSAEIVAIALEALPFADDAEIALGPLSERLGQAPGRSSVLQAMLAIAGRPRRQREPLDLEGGRRAGEALIKLASDPRVIAEERALAVSAARALAEGGLADARRIPTDLDPP